MTELDDELRLSAIQNRLLTRLHDAALPAVRARAWIANDLGLGPALAALAYSRDEAGSQFHRLEALGDDTREALRDHERVAESWNAVLRRLDLQLHEHLKAGRFLAFGVDWPPLPSSQHIPLTPIRWIDLVLDVESGRATGSRETFADVKVIRVDDLKPAVRAILNDAMKMVGRIETALIFSAARPGASVRVRKGGPTNERSAAMRRLEAEVAQWIGSRVSALQPGARLPGNEDLLKEARQQWGSEELTVGVWKRARKAANIDPKLTKGGRPPKPKT